MKLTFSNLETKRFLKEISTYTSTFVEDQTISSSLQGCWALKLVIKRTLPLQQSLHFYRMYSILSSGLACKKASSELFIQRSLNSPNYHLYITVQGVRILNPCVGILLLLTYLQAQDTFLVVHTSIALVFSSQRQWNDRADQFGQRPPLCFYV